MSGRQDKPKMDLSRGNDVSQDQRMTQCLILMAREQNYQKELLDKLVSEMGQLRENVFEKLEKVQDSLDTMNRKLSARKMCVCGGNIPDGVQKTAGTKPKRLRRPVRRSPENSDDDTDPNINHTGPDKGLYKPGLDFGRRPQRESPIPIKSDPPGNVRRPVATSKPLTNGNAAMCNMIKAPLPKKALLKIPPQETDFIDLMKALKMEVNPATIAAISSAAHMNNNSLESRPPALHTVLILDTSESMRGKTLEIARTFVNKVIDGIDLSAGEFGLEEYLAVITCGESTSILQPFTNDFLQVRNTIARLKVGGRTPLMTSLTLALCYLELQSECVKVADHVIMPRVIVVSDFDATIDKQFKGRDADNSEDRIKVQRELFNLGLTFKSRGYGVVCVPVGESNDPVAEGFVAKCNGDLVNPTAVNDVGNYYRYQMVIGRAYADFEAGVRSNQELDVYSLVQRAMPQAGLDRKHETAVLTLLEKILQKEDDIADTDEEPYIAPSASRKGRPAIEEQEPPDLLEWTPTRNVDNIGFEEESGLPQIGSRVKRAEDWKWGDQDNNGPGTVVGHKQKGIAYILWDNGLIGAYRHGLNGQYDVRKSQELRHVAPGDIEVGCCVIRGADWERGDEDGGIGTVGVVVRKLRDRYVMVRWPSRVIETYRFGHDNKWDLEVTLDMPHTARSETPGAIAENQRSHTHTPDPLPANSQTNAASGDLKPWWFWKDKHNQWRPFSEANVNKIENKCGSGLPQHCLVEYENKPVKLYLSENVCVIGDEKYPVKREMLKAEEVESMKMLEAYLQPID